MKMHALVALQNLTYASRNIKVGQTFNASPRDARILVAIKRAQIDPAGHSPRPAAMPPVVEQPIKELVTEAVGMKQEQQNPYGFRTRRTRASSPRKAEG